MKTLCVAVFALSLISVCQAASLACQKLTQTVDKDPDISGTWYHIALSSDNCWAITLFNAFFWPSISMDVKAKGTPNLYDATVKFKMFGLCANDSEPFHFANHKMFNVDSNNAPTGKGDVLLHTGCPDCIVVKDVDTISTFTLFSRRKSVDAAELKEFEAQAECLGWSKPVVMSTDHDYVNCVSVDGEEEISSDAALSFFIKMFERMKNMHHKITEFFKDCLFSYITTSF